MRTPRVPRIAKYRVDFPVFGNNKKSKFTLFLEFRLKIAVLLVPDGYYEPIDLEYLAAICMNCVRDMKSDRIVTDASLSLLLTILEGLFLFIVDTYLYTITFIIYTYIIGVLMY